MVMAASCYGAGSLCIGSKYQFYSTWIALSSLAQHLKSEGEEKFDLSAGQYDPKRKSKVNKGIASEEGDRCFGIAQADPKS